MRVPQDVFEWGWLVLFVTMCTVRKVHERRAGRRSTLRNLPVTEALLMILWGCLAGVAPLLLIFSPLLDFANLPFGFPWTIRAVGLVLFAVSIWLVHRSHADLGRMWSPTVEFRDEHELVTEGVYKRVRHPMYAGHIIWGVSQAVLMPNVVAGPLALLVMLAILQIRVPREERAMIDYFGDAYLTYMKETGRVFPRMR
ncbi:MAG: protein-S-isoprenylcysteine O-methyltransferase [Planctomycetota bacterium]